MEKQTINSEFVLNIEGSINWIKVFVKPGYFTNCILMPPEPQQPSYTLPL